MEEYKRAVFTLNPAESKRLIGKAVSQMPVVQRALREGKVFIAGGTTNAFVAEEILKISLPKERYTSGIVTQGFQCITPAEERMRPFLLVRGKVWEGEWGKEIETFGAGDVFIKGANAVDAEGFAGVLLADRQGGTIARLLGLAAARGITLIVPVGLEKMIPSVRAAARAAGIERWDYRLGMAVGMMPVMNGIVVTEVQALEILFGVKATPLAAGGVGGSEGAVVLAIEGVEKNVSAAWETIKQIKGEKPIPSLKRSCADCPDPCDL